MSEDPAPYFVDGVIEDLVRRMQAAQTLSLKIDYARQIVAAKRARGGYPEIQGTLPPDTVDALARLEAQALVMNLEGERYD